MVYLLAHVFVQLDILMMDQMNYAKLAIIVVKPAKAHYHLTVLNVRMMFSDISQF